MTLDEIAEVRPELLDFTAEMLGGLARKDQRAAGELYVRGLLADGRRKSMVPMAERLGVDSQQLQQFITSSTWDYAGVRRSVARWFARHQPVEALVVDDTGFPKDGDASPLRSSRRRQGSSSVPAREHKCCWAASPGKCTVGRSSTPDQRRRAESVDMIGCARRWKTEVSQHRFGRETGDRRSPGSSGCIALRRVVTGTQRLEDMGGRAGWPGKSWGLL